MGRTERRSQHLAVPAGPIPLGEFVSSVATLFRKSSCACGGGCPSCNSGSHDHRVSQPNDPAEIEADRMADQIMRMPAGDLRTEKRDELEPSHHAVDTSPVLHRKCDACAEEEDEEPIQRKAVFESGGSLASNQDSHVRDAIGSGGRPSIGQHDRSSKRASAMTSRTSGYIPARQLKPRQKLSTPKPTHSAAILFSPP